MIKEKKQQGVENRTNYRIAKRFAECFGFNKRKYTRSDSRRRMRIRAKRQLIRHECYVCRLALLGEGYDGDGLHFDNKGYAPIDDCECRRCRWIMRGGLH